MHVYTQDQLFLLGNLINFIFNALKLSEIPLISAWTTKKFRIFKNIKKGFKNYFFPGLSACITKKFLSYPVHMVHALLNEIPLSSACTYYRAFTLYINRN